MPGLTAVVRRVGAPGGRSPGGRTRPTAVAPGARLIVCSCTNPTKIDDILKLLVRLSERGITIVLIEHIMSAVMSFSQRLVVLVSGKKIADGKPDEVVRNPEVEKAYLG